jgi:hypothetical protein
MEDTSGFYKNDNGYVLHGPNFVLNANYELRKETKDQHTYPTDGWYWFDSVEEAYTFFGLEYIPLEKNIGE